VPTEIIHDKFNKHIIIGYEASFQELLFACQKPSLDDIIRGTELEFVIMVIAVSCVKLLSAHNSTQHTSRKHKV